MAAWLQHCRTRSVPGRKRDVSDCQWTVSAHSEGLRNQTSVRPFRLWVSSGIVKRPGGSIRMLSSVHPNESGTCFLFFPNSSPGSVESTYVSSSQLAKTGWFTRRVNRRFYHWLSGARCGLSIRTRDRGVHVPGTTTCDGAIGTLPVWSGDRRRVASCIVGR